MKRFTQFVREEAHKVGDLVKFRIPHPTSPSGTNGVAGTIKRILPDGRLEVKSQQHGYFTLDPETLTLKEAGGGGGGSAGGAGGSSGGGMSGGGDPGEGEGVAANNAGEGNIAGIGVNKAGKPANWGEPGVDLRKHRQDEAGNEYDYTNDIMTDEYDVREELVRENLIEAVETFAGAPVFTVDMDRVMKSRFGKNRYHRYDRYVGNDSVGEAIRQYGRKNPGDIILKDEKTAVMSYLRRATPVGE